MLTRRVIIPVLLITAGVFIASIGVLAEQLGLDPSAGWGPRRIAVILLGSLIAVGTLPIRHYLDKSLHSEPRAGGSLRTSRLKMASTGPNSWMRAAAIMQQYWMLVPVSALVLGAYIWFATSGTWSTWTSQTRYYADLARGFQKGHLYLAIKVPSKLIHSPDPYEPVAPWVSQGPIDYSYFQGRYYLPWEPVPALIVWLVRVLGQRWLGDLQLSFGFLCGVFLVQCALLLRSWRQYFQGLPGWLLWTSILLAGLAGPSTFMLNNYNAGRIYDAAVAGGQLFLLGGFLAALIWLESAFSRIAGLSAGLLWILAIGTRPDTVVPVGVMVLCLSAWAFCQEGWSARLFRRLLWVAAPLLLGSVLVGWYNWARFGSIWETGYFYQMAGVNIHKHWNERFSLGYLIPNLYNYLLNPVLFTREFPFVHIQAGMESAVSEIASIPAFYHAQMVTGLVWTAPFTILVCMLLYRKQAAPSVGQAQLDAPDIQNLRGLNRMELTLALSCLGSFALVMGYFWAAMRFLENFMPSLMVLAALGLWHGYQLVSGNRVRRLLYSVVAVVLAAASVAVSMLGAISVLMLRFDLAHLFPR